MRVGILGAGAEGSGLGALLAAEPDVEEIRYGDVDERSLAMAIEGVRAVNGTVSVSGRTVDGTLTGDVVDWGRGLDVIANPTMPPTNLPTMRSCLEVGAHYLDLFAFPFDIPGVVPYEQTIDAQFELDEAFRAADRTAISCAGVAPGWVDVTARYIMDPLQTVDTVIVRWVEWNDGSELISTVGPSLIANFNMPRPICWHDGAVREVDLFGSEEVYEWPAPIGEAHLYTGFLHPELRTIRNTGREIGHIECKSGLVNGKWRTSRDIWVEALRRQLDEGAATGEADMARRLGASFIPPERYQEAIRRGIVSRGAFAVSVEAKGRTETHEVDHTVYLVVTLEEAIQRLPGSTHMVYATSGTTPITLVCMLGRNEIASRGVVGVGGLDEWKTVLQRVQERGHVMTERIEMRGLLTL